jgi:hypothetical protein
MVRLSLALLVTTAAGMAAQSSPSSRFPDNCNRYGRDDRAHFCEERNLAMPATQSLTVDGRANGGVTVHGWDRNQIQVVAMVQTTAQSEGDAQSLARQVNVVANGSDVHSDGPRTHGAESWSVSYEVWAPRGTNLALRSTNGGLAVDAMNATLDLQTVNGGLSLSDVNGDVRGVTTNGGITARLSGDRWIGAGLDLSTSNGGVHLYLPDNYSANLETGTTNGTLNVGFPVTVQGRFAQHISTQIGSGGAPIRAVTTNGGVSITKS